jgi:hypothetical protein
MCMGRELQGHWRSQEKIVDISYNGLPSRLATYSMNDFALFGRSRMRANCDILMRRRRVHQAPVRLFAEAGFEPVAVGSPARAKEFDAGSPIFGRALTAVVVRREFGRKP